MRDENCSLQSTSSRLLFSSGRCWPLKKSSLHRAQQYYCNGQRPDYTIVLADINQNALFHWSTLTGWAFQQVDVNRLHQKRSKLSTLLTSIFTALFITPPPGPHSTLPYNRTQILSRPAFKITKYHRDHDKLRPIIGPHSEYYQPQTKPGSVISGPEAYYSQPQRVPLPARKLIKSYSHVGTITVFDFSKQNSHLSNWHMNY